MKKKLKNERGLYRSKFRDRKTGEIKESPFWTISYECKGCEKHEKGGLHRETTHLTDKTAAKRERDSKKGTVAKGEPLIEVNDIMLTDLLKDAIKWSKVHRKASTSAEYQNIYDLHLKEAFTGVRAIAVCLNPLILTNFVASKQKDYSDSRINGMLQLISRAFKLAENRLPRPAIEKLDTGDNSRKVFFTDAETATLLKYLPAEIARPVEMLNLTGWRLCEMLSRQKHHIENNSLVLEPGYAKNKAPRTFPLEGRVAEIIKEQAEASKSVLSDWLFHDNLGKPFVRYYEKWGYWKPQKNFLRPWKEALEKAKLVGRIRHDFRRSAVRRFDEVPDHVGMELSGHKSAAVYRKYKATTEADKREAVKKLYGDGSTKLVQSSTKAK